MYAPRFLPTRATTCHRSCCLLILSCYSLIVTTSARAASPLGVITSAPGYAITWDRNNGGFLSPDSGAGRSRDVALPQYGATACRRSALAPLRHCAYHR